MDSERIKNSSMWEDTEHLVIYWQKSFVGKSWMIPDSPREFRNNGKRQIAV